MTMALSGCLALPGAISLGSLAIDGMSMFMTGKSLNDHALSIATNSDCVIMRVMTTEPMCAPFDLADVDQGEHTLSAFNENNADGSTIALSAEDERLLRLSESWLNADQQPTPEKAAQPLAALEVSTTVTRSHEAAVAMTEAALPVVGQPYEMRIIGVMSAHPPTAN